MGEKNLSDGPKEDATSLEYFLEAAGSTVPEEPRFGRGKRSQKEPKQYKSAPVKKNAARESPQSPEDDLEVETGEKVALTQLAGDGEESSPSGEEGDGISSIRMRGIEKEEWNSSVDAINISVNRDVFLESVFVFHSYDLNVRNKFKQEIYHAATGEMLLREIEDTLKETDVAEIGELEPETVLKLESGRTYTAVLETRGQKSFGGRKGSSLCCCPISYSMRSLTISYTQPRKELLEEFLTNTNNKTSEVAGQLPGFFFKLVSN